MIDRICARIRARLRYNKRLNDLVITHYALGYGMSPATYESYRQQARRETQAPSEPAAP